MMRCTLSQSNLSNSAAWVSDALAKSTCTAKASNISVKRDPGSAHGGTNVTTLCSSQEQRGRQARICVVNRITSKCRHVRSRG